MENLLNILGKVGFDWQVALANLFNFLIIFFILKKYAFGPIGKIIKERQASINEGLASAEKNTKLLENTKKEQEQILLNARAEANNIILEAKKDAAIKREQLVEDTKKDISLMIENNKKHLEIEKTKMLTEAKKEIVTLVIQTTEKVLGKKVDNDYSNNVIKELSAL